MLKASLALVYSFPTERWHICRGLSEIPQVSCVYVVYLRGIPIYIGRAKNLRSRFRNHQVDNGRIGGHEYDGHSRDVRIGYLLCDSESLRCSIERQLIQRLQPRFNKHFRSVAT